MTTRGNRITTTYHMGPDETLEVSVDMVTAYPDALNEGLSTLVAGFIASLDTVLARTRTQVDE